MVRFVLGRRDWKEREGEEGKNGKGRKERKGTDDTRRSNGTLKKENIEKEERKRKGAESYLEINRKRFDRRKQK